MKHRSCREIVHKTQRLRIHFMFPQSRTLKPCSEPNLDSTLRRLLTARRQSYFSEAVIIQGVEPNTIFRSTHGYMLCLLLHS